MSDFVREVLKSSDEVGFDNELCNGIEDVCRVVWTEKLRDVVFIVRGDSVIKFGVKGALERTVV